MKILTLVAIVHSFVTLGLSAQGADSAESRLGAASILAKVRSCANGEAGKIILEGGQEKLLAAWMLEDVKWMKGDGELDRRAREIAWIVAAQQGDEGAKKKLAEAGIQAPATPTDLAKDMARRLRELEGLLVAAKTEK